MEAKKEKDTSPPLPPGAEPKVDALLLRYEQEWFMDRFGPLLPYEKAAIKTFLAWYISQRPSLPSQSSAPPSNET